MDTVRSLTPAPGLPAAPSGAWRRGSVLGMLVAFWLLAVPALAQIPVTAAWDPSGDSTIGYDVSVGVTPGVPLVTLNVGAATSVTLPFPPGAVYFVSVRGYNASGMRGFGTPELAVDLANAPGAPDSLQASVTGALASLSWAPPSSGGLALRYLLSVGTSPGTSNILSEAPVGNLLSASGAVPPGTYYARVQAGNLVGIGPPTPDVVFQVGSPAPPLPAPTGVGISANGRTVSLGWRAVAGASSYLVEAGSSRGASNLGVFNVGNTTSLVAPVPPGVYYVRVRAANGAGVSSPSNDVAIQVR